MYAFVSHTYNPMKGECEHSCSYCFMRRKLLLPPLRLELKELKVNLGEGNFIFVGSSTDEWAANVPSEWIEQILDYCDGFDNKYLFQSKNPEYSGTSRTCGCYAGDRQLWNPHLCNL